MATNGTVRFYRGDDVTLRCVVTNADGTEYSLVGCKIRLVMKTLRADVDSVAVVSKDITEALTSAGQIFNAAGGLADFFIATTDTKNRSGTPPPAGDLALEGSEQNQYVLGIRIKTATGKYVTLFDGFTRLLREVVSENFA